MRDGAIKIGESDKRSSNSQQVRANTKRTVPPTKVATRLSCFIGPPPIRIINVSLRMGLKISHMRGERPPRRIRSIYGAKYYSRPEAHGGRRRGNSTAFSWHPFRLGFAPAGWLVWGRCDGRPRGNGGTWGRER